MLFLSFGAGVQSSVMLMLAIEGAIERPDHVIFADTGWETDHTYRHVRWFRNQCKKADIPFHVVTSGNIRENMVIARTADSGEYQGNYATMPLFVDTGVAVGRLKRQCTSDHKITPIRRKQRRLLGYKSRQRIPEGSCAVMIGISTDEARRASPSRARWVDNVYPLIDPLKMSRRDCQKWWQDHFPHIQLRKSSCVGCPFHSDREWLEMSRAYPEEFKDACDFDEQIRGASGIQGKSYLHKSLTPLAEIDFGQKQLGFDLEDEVYCAGGCGL